MVVALKEACAKCGKAMTDTEIGDYWYHSEMKPGFKCLCTSCARFHCFYEPTGSVVLKLRSAIADQDLLL